MKATTLRRLHRLETIAGEDDDTPRAIMWRIVGSDQEPLPVLGWKSMTARDPLRVMRRPGEADEDLKARAIEEARDRRTDPLSVPCLLAIVEDADDAS